MKETFYFSHDYNARSDGKLVKVMMKHGVAGIGSYWCIIEMLYEEQGYLSIKEYDRIAFELRVSYEMIESLINDYGLFTTDDDNFWSNSVIDRIKQRMDKSEKARISVQKRWDKKNEKDTIVLRTNYDSNTIKERKGKEIKEKEIETDTLPTVIEQALVPIEKIDNRNFGTQRIINIVQSEVLSLGYLYEKHAQDRNRATIISKRQSDWGEFIKDSPEEKEEKMIRQIINYSNSNEFVKKIRSVYDFHEKWKSVANAIKQSVSQVPESRTF